MDIVTNEHIEELLERFFEGKTSNTEEQLLYDFFAGNNVPEHLLNYKDIFTYFGNDIKEEFGEIKPDIPVRRIKIRKWILWTGVAASLLVLVLFNPFAYGNNTFDPYEGSYIIRNGVRITDMKIIRPELEATVQQILQQQEDLEQLKTMMEKESQFPDEEESLKAHYNSILEDFENENIRNEIRKIFEQE